MNHFIYQFIQRKIATRGGQANSPYSLAKKFRQLRIKAISMLKHVLLIATGIFSAAFGLKSFLLPNQFIDGGATGITLLLTGITGLHFAVIITLVNAPFILMGAKIIGRRFAVKTIAAILLLALVVTTVQFPVITQEKILVALFGGFFLGAGIGLAVRGGCVIDGTEVLAIFLSRKLRTTVGDIITLLNIFIFSAAAYLLSIETAMYSMITYLAASRTVDFIIEGIEEYTGITIISPHNEEIRRMITQKLGHGVTVYKGRRGFGNSGNRDEMDIIYTVVTRLEISRLSTEIDLIDSNAFIMMSSIKDTRGGMVKKRPLKH